MTSEAAAQYWHLTADGTALSSTREADSGRVKYVRYDSSRPVSRADLVSFDQGVARLIARSDVVSRWALIGLIVGIVLVAGGFLVLPLVGAAGGVRLALIVVGGVFVVLGIGTAMVVPARSLRAIERLHDEAGLNSASAEHGGCRGRATRHVARHRDVPQFDDRWEPAPLIARPARLRAAVSPRRSPQRRARRRRRGAAWRACRRGSSGR